MDLTEQANMPYTYLERRSACSVLCSRGYSAADTGFRHQEPSHNRSQAVFRLIFGRALARPPCPQVLQCQPRVAKGSSGHSSARRPLPQVSQCHPGVAKGSSVGSTAALRHGHPAHKPLSGIPAWRRGLLTALRHGHPAHKPLSGNPAWRGGLLIGLRHGHQAYKYLSGIPAWRRWSSISARP